MNALFRLFFWVIGSCEYSLLGIGEVKISAGVFFMNIHLDISLMVLRLVLLYNRCACDVGGGGS